MNLKKIETDKIYILQDAFKRYIKAIYRNGSLFTQTLKGSKSNFFDITKKEALVLLSGMTLSDKKFVSYGIGWNIA